jgi:hypothetical protein
LALLVGCHKESVTHGPVAANPSPATVSFHAAWSQSELPEQWSEDGARKVHALPITPGRVDESVAILSTAAAVYPHGFLHRLDLQVYLLSDLSFDGAAPAAQIG